MKARELVGAATAHEAGERRDRARVSGFHHGERLEVNTRSAARIFGGRQRLQGTDRFRSTLQQEISDGAADEALGSCGNIAADTDGRAELLVRRLQTSSDVDGVAISRVLEEAAAAEIADDRRSGVNTDPRRSQGNPALVPEPAELACERIEGKRTHDRARRMIELLARRPEQHVQRVADDLCDRAVMGEDDLRHAGEVVVQKRLEYLWVERLDKRGEAGDIGEERRYFAALSAKVDRLAVRRQPFGEIRREVARERRVRAFGGNLAAPASRRMPTWRMVFAIVVSRSTKSIGLVTKSNAPRFIAVRMFAMSPYAETITVDRFSSPSWSFPSNGQPVHSRHVDIAEYHVDIAVPVEHGQRLDAVMGEEEAHAAIPDLPPEFLQDQSFEVGLIVDDEDFRAHPTCPSRASISSRNMAKSIGFVSRDLAPPSSALRLVSSSP